MIVVGVDHSDGATEALRFALQEARLRRVRLRAVHAVGASYPVLGEELVHPIREGEFEELARVMSRITHGTHYYQPMGTRVCRRSHRAPGPEGTGAALR